MKDFIKSLAQGVIFAFVFGGFFVLVTYLLLYLR